jgi:hypothetical protein
MIRVRTPISDCFVKKISATHFDSSVDIIYASGGWERKGGVQAFATPQNIAAIFIGDNLCDVLCSAQEVVGPVTQFGSRSPGGPILPLHLPRRRNAKRHEMKNTDSVIYSASTLSSVIAYPSPRCLHWTSDGQVCFITKNVVYILVCYLVARTECHMV